MLECEQPHTYTDNQQAKDSGIFLGFYFSVSTIISLCTTAAAANPKKVTIAPLFEGAKF